MNPETKLKILFSIIIITIIGGVAAGVFFSLQEKGEAKSSQLVVDHERYDFGQVSMAQGIAKHTFIITNQGESDLKISDISTSCMCTTAVLEIDGERSPTFGMHDNPLVWSAKLKSGQQAKLEVAFDPLAHGPEAIGPVTRAITLFSNANGKISAKTTLMISADVIK